MHPELFAPAFEAWLARPSDPNDTLVAQGIYAGPRHGGVALFGVPFDGAVIGRRGAKDGPAAIRRELARLKPWTVERGERTLHVADWGDVRLPATSVAAAHDAVEKAARAVREMGAFPVALGGDHSLTFPLARPLLEGRRIGVINLDAHLDVRDVHHGALNSGQAFGRLIEAGLLRGENYAALGVRDFATSPRYGEKAAKAGATVVSAREWREWGLSAVEKAIDAASRGTDGVYLSVDVDVLDQAHAPGVSAPTPGGVDTTELYAAVRLIAQRARLVGADFVETAPSLDRDGMTARAAAFAVAHLVAARPG